MDPDSYAVLLITMIYKRSKQLSYPPWKALQRRQLNCSGKIRLRCVGWKGERGDRKAPGRYLCVSEATLQSGADGESREGEAKAGSTDIAETGSTGQGEDSTRVSSLGRWAASSAI